jgi:hypothetical protein
MISCEETFYADGSHWVTYFTNDGGKHIFGSQLAYDMTVIQRYDCLNDLIIYDISGGGGN